MRKTASWKLLVGILLVGVMLTALLGGCAPAAAPEPAPAPDAPAPAPAPEPEPAPGRISIRWNTADVGSYGYSVASLMVELLNRELPNKLDGNYVVTIHPFPATGAGMKAAMEGDGYIAYTADVGMTQVYAQEGAYSPENWPNLANADLLVHSFYAYPMETSLAVHANRADDFKTWGDLDGEPVFFTPAGFMNWLNMGRIFAALGYEFNHTEIDSGMTADALRDGSIAGAAVYTTAGRSLPTYWREAEMRLAEDLRVISPSDDEMAKLQAAGLTPVSVDPSVPFSHDVGTDQYWAVPILFGYNVMAEAPAEFVKAKLEIFHENVDALANYEAGFGPLAADFVGMQVAGIRANPHIPVHAGMAEFLKDQGQWDDSWTIAQ